MSDASPRAPRGPRVVFSREDRVMGVLLLLVPATIVSTAVGAPPWAQFFLSVGAVIPLAAFIGTATEVLANRLGGKIGGLLNATFGNAPDILVGVFGVQKGLIPLVKATLIGALISNSALIMGVCYVVAGLTYGRPRFKRDEAGHHSVLMMLTLAAVLFPSLGATLGGHASAQTIQGISVGIAVVLLLIYAAYVAFGIFGIETFGRRAAPRPEGREAHTVVEEGRDREATGWPVWLGVAALVGATVALVPITNTLTDTVTSVTQVLGWTDVFVGIVIVANAGNVAEAYAAIRFARARAGRPEDAPGGDSGLDLALGIASASSVQIATFVAPVIVLYSLFAHPMTLVFSPVEIAILALLVVMFAYIGQDGESNWLEGAQLLALYIMAAILFFALPVAAFAG